MNVPVLEYNLHNIHIALTSFSFFFFLKLREYCLRLRNMVASSATKAELSEAMDTMIEEVSKFVECVK